MAESIATAAISLIFTVGTALRKIYVFMSDVRQARKDLDSVARELTSLQLCLETLGADGSSRNVTYSETISKQIKQVIIDCEFNISEVLRILAKLQLGRVGRRIQWVMGDQDQVYKIRSSLASHKATLEIALTMGTISILARQQAATLDQGKDVGEIRSNTESLLVSAATIKGQTTSILASTIKGQTTSILASTANIEDRVKTLTEIQRDVAYHINIEISGLRSQIYASLKEGRSSQSKQIIIEESRTYLEQIYKSVPVIPMSTNEELDNPFTDQPSASDSAKFESLPRPDLGMCVSCSKSLVNEAEVARMKVFTDKQMQDRVTRQSQLEIAENRASSLSDKVYSLQQDLDRLRMVNEAESARMQDLTDKQTRDHAASQSQLEDARNRETKLKNEVSSLQRKFDHITKQTGTSDVTATVSTALKKSTSRQSTISIGRSVPSQRSSMSLDPLSIRSPKLNADPQYHTCTVFMLQPARSHRMDLLPNLYSTMNVSPDSAVATGLNMGQFMQNAMDYSQQFRSRLGVGFLWFQNSIGGIRSPLKTMARRHDYDCFANFTEDMISILEVTIGGWGSLHDSHNGHKFSESNERMAIIDLSKLNLAAIPLPSPTEDEFKLSQAPSYYEDFDILEIRVLRLYPDKTLIFIPLKRQTDTHFYNGTIERLRDHFFKVFIGFTIRHSSDWLTYKYIKASLVRATRSSPISEWFTEDNILLRYEIPANQGVRPYESTYEVPDDNSLVFDRTTLSAMIPHTRRLYVTLKLLLTGPTYRY